MKTVNELTELELILLKEFTDFRYKALGIRKDKTIYHQLCEELAYKYFRITSYDSNVIDNAFNSMESK